MKKSNCIVILNGVKNPELRPIMDSSPLRIVAQNDSEKEIVSTK